jgi:amidase
VCVDSVDIGAAGPMANTAQDLALAMRVLAEPVRSFGPHGWQASRWSATDKPLKELRVAVVCDDPVAPVDRSISGKLDELAAFLRGHVASVDQDSRPVDSEEARVVYLHLVRAATGVFMDDATYAQTQSIAATLAPDDMSFRACNYRGYTLTHRDWFAYDQRRIRLRMAWEQFFQRVDLLICPVASTSAFKHNQAGQRWERMLEVNGQMREGTEPMFWAGYPGMIGLPATAFPLGTDANGLPIGAQIIAPAFADPLAIGFADFLARAWFAPRAPQC